MNRDLAYWQSRICFEFSIGKKLYGNLREVKEFKTLLGVGFMLTFRIDKTIDDSYQLNLVYDFEILNTKEDITIEEKTVRHDLIFLIQATDYRSRI